MTRSFPVTSGTALPCKGWRREGLLRLLEKVLAVGEDPDNLVVSGVTLIADGSDAADERLRLSLTNDTATGVMRYADAGYEESFDEIARGDIDHFRLEQ